MGFETADRTFRIGVSDTQAYRQFGNAVVVPVVEAIARHMQPHLQAALTKRREERRSKNMKNGGDAGDEAGSCVTS
jgi:DNA (cytosine-5)-methyltransferase 1